MTLPVAFAVLFAALCHAAWNAMVRFGDDKLVAIALVVIGSGVLAVPLLFFFPLPPGAAWPYLIASAIIHVGYNLALAMSYHHGELTKAYPLLRGSAPLTTLAFSLVFLNEAVDASEVAGIVVLAAGIMALAFEGGWRAVAASPHTVVYAAATSLCITAYTLADGLGARVADSAHQYAAWLFAFNMLPMLAVVAFARRRAFTTAAKANWRGALAGGALSLAAYWIAIWAMTVAPIPLVAALRETSILFALFIGRAWLRERITPVRTASIVLMLCGLVLMRL